MTHRKFSFRDPGTVARDIPGILDILFPRLAGGLVTLFNKRIFSFEDINQVPDELVKKSRLQKAMLFEIAMAYAESLLAGNSEPDWADCLKVASERQRKHYDAKIPREINEIDEAIATHAAKNLVAMLKKFQGKYPGTQLETSPIIPGLGWIASGTGDFSLGRILIEVKHTNRNFTSGDFRQVLMYWMLKYAASTQSKEDVWSDVLLLNPRRNAALLIDFEYLLQSASANSNWVELFGLLRSIVDQDLDRH